MGSEPGKRACMFSGWCARTYIEICCQLPKGLELHPNTCSAQRVGEGTSLLDWGNIEQTIDKKQTTDVE